MIPKTYQAFDKHYSDTSFWQTLARIAKRLGGELTLKALQLFYASRRSDIPIWAKTTIYGALGYLISLVDFIPDITPVVGYVDDLSVLTAALATVARYIDTDVKTKAQAKYQQWFG